MRVPIRSGLTVAVAGLAPIAVCLPVQAASDITTAAIATGHLYVIGTTEHPHMPVMLEGRFSTESDDAGKYQYELVYHPARCIVAAEIEGKTYEAVVGNCGQQGPAGPQGEAATPASTAAIKVPTATGTTATDAAASAALPATATTSPPLPPARPEPAQLSALAVDRGRSAVVPAKAPEHQIAVRTVPSHSRKLAPKVRIERRDPNEGEIPLAD